MNSQEPIFALIKGMTQTEKRAFKRTAFLNKATEAGHFTILFDAIDKQKMYDEAKLKKRLPAGALRNNFATFKYQLYQYLLYVLADYHYSISSESVVAHLQHQARVLFRRGLLAQCHKIQLKAMAKAKEHELFAQMLDMLEQERATVSFLYHGQDLLLRFEKILQEKKYVMAMLSNLGIYEALRDRLYSFYVKTGVGRTAADAKILKAIMSAPVLKSEKEALSVRAKLMFHYPWYTYGFIIGNTKMMLLHARAQIQIYELSINMIKDNLTKYQHQLHQLATVESDLFLEKDFLHTLAKIRELPTKYSKQCTDFTHANIIESVLYFELDYAETKAEPERVTKILEEHENELEHYLPMFTEASVVVVFYKIATLLMEAGKPKQALDWFERIMAFRNQPVREDIQAFTRILQLMCYFEIGSLKILPSVLKSTYRSLNKKDRLYPLEKMFLATMHKLANKPEKKVKDYFIELRHEMLALQKDENEAYALQYFPFIEWVTAQIENVSTAQVMKRNNKK
ncbi:MAG: hypothetical protein NTY88_08425 [Bacteroidetes bacterium]|nr:hypothetical protein [Bacteroidota bacterium]